ncbi:hypothetical protein, partial [Treponema succinifaciens]|uniref:hypothetical protein n=1 Tax=Treponema succinifaciens TaxID=167 RepID=UPI0023F65A5B
NKHYYHHTGWIGNLKDVKVSFKKAPAGRRSFNWKIKSHKNPLLRVPKAHRKKSKNRSKGA